MKSFELYTTDSLLGLQLDIISENETLRIKKQ